jgi:hypothetical protein
MGGIRNFAAHLGHTAPLRNVDNTHLLLSAKRIWRRAYWLSPFEIPAFRIACAALKIRATE